MSQAFTGYVDTAQVVLYIFWLFFAGLIFYLHRENKREGYPLETERSGTGRFTVRGFPDLPAPKTFVSHDGTAFVAPEYSHDRADAPVAPSAEWPGSPFVPLGNPMLDGVGPASYADRADVPERGMSGQAILMPLRKAVAHHVAPDGPNPMGMRVECCDGVVAGTVTDIWIDEAESIIRYLEIDIGAERTRLLPMAMARLRSKAGVIKVASIKADQFSGVPVLRAYDEVSKREEDRIAAYFAGGHLYATPSRMGPIL